LVFSQLIDHGKEYISKMKLTTAFSLFAANLIGAVDMSPYKAGPGVEAGFATFVEE
jgi:hypothetical protein